MTATGAGEARLHAWLAGESGLAADDVAFWLPRLPSSARGDWDETIACLAAIAALVEENRTGAGDWWRARAARRRGGPAMGLGSVGENGAGPLPAVSPAPVPRASSLEALDAGASVLVAETPAGEPIAAAAAETRRCGVCGEDLPRDAYYPSEWARAVGKPRCRDCHRAGQVASRARQRPADGSPAETGVPAPATHPAGGAPLGVAATLDALLARLGGEEAALREEVQRLGQRLAEVAAQRRAVETTIGLLGDGR